MHEGRENVIVPMLRSAGRTLVRRLPAGTVMLVLSGPLRGARWLVRSGDAGHWVGTYELEVQRLMCRLLRPGQLFFDVGAHAGFHALLASRLVGPGGRVVAFEPHPSNVSNLRRHVALNRARNITVVPVAVAESVGRGGLMQGDNLYESRLVSDGQIPVEVTSLDAYTKGSGLSPHVVKIDVEGAERRVLEGAEVLLHEVRPSLLLSVHDRDDLPGLTAKLQGAGYDVVDTFASHELLVATPRVHVWVFVDDNERG